MFTQRLAIAATGIVVAMSGAALAAAPWPTSVNESAPSEAAGPQPQRRPAFDGARAAFPGNFPVSVNETGPADRPVNVTRNVGATGAATPSSSPRWRIPRGTTPDFPSSVSDQNPSR